jgi:hypothetical protein
VADLSSGARTAPVIVNSLFDEVLDIIRVWMIIAIFEIYSAGATIFYD